MKTAVKLANTKPAVVVENPNSTYMVEIQDKSA